MNCRIRVWEVFVGENTKRPMVGETMTEEEREFEEKQAFVLPEPIPSFSLGAFFMPPIWGAGHGQWMTLFFYPLWVFCDSLFRSAYYTRSTLSIVGSIVIGLCMLAVTLFYGMTAQKPAYYRVRNKYTPEQYAKRERVWNVFMIIIGVIFLILATYYNIYWYVPEMV